MSEESRGGVLEDTTTDILDQDQDHEQEMRPNHYHNSRRYENPNHKSNTVPERPVKKILKKKKKSNAGKICSFTGVVLVILIIGAILLVKFQKEIESKMFSLKSPETENRTILPETEIEKKNLDQSPEQNKNSGGKSSVLVEKKKEKENKSEVINEDNESEPEDSEEENGGTVDGDTMTEPEPQHVPISVGADGSKKTKPPPPKEEPVVLPENPTTEHLFKAIEDGDVRMAKALIKYGVDLKKFNNEGYNTLHYAAKKLNVEIMKAILESGLIDIHSKSSDANYMTALHIVSRFADSTEKSVEAAKLLVHYGAEIEALACNNFTPLIFVVTSAVNAQLVQYLVDAGANPNHKDSKIKYSPLHYSMRKCDKNSIQVLLKSGANPAELNPFLRQPIHEAARLGCVAGIEMLSIQGIDINVKTPSQEFDQAFYGENFDKIFFGSTPLHFAAMEGKKEAVIFLLSISADPVVFDDTGTDAIEYAEENENHEIAAYISNVQANRQNPDSLFNINRNS